MRRSPLIIVDFNTIVIIDKYLRGNKNNERNHHNLARWATFFNSINQFRPESLIVFLISTRSKTSKLILLDNEQELDDVEDDYTNSPKSSLWKSFSKILNFKKYLCYQSTGGQGFLNHSDLENARKMISDKHQLDFSQSYYLSNLPIKNFWLSSIRLNTDSLNDRINNNLGSGNSAYDCIDDECARLMVRVLYQFNLLKNVSFENDIFLYKALWGQLLVDIDTEIARLKEKNASSKVNLLREFKRLIHENHQSKTLTEIINIFKTLFFYENGQRISYYAALCSHRGINLFDKPSKSKVWFDSLPQRYPQLLHRSLSDIEAANQQAMQRKNEMEDGDQKRDDDGEFHDVELSSSPKQ